MAKPPMKHWQRRRPLASSGSTTNHPSSSTSSTQGPSSSSSASRLAKIDLQVQVARGMMRSAFQKFREMFQYEVPDAEDIYDNPLYRLGVEGTKLELEVDERQPTIVTHRMYWQGNEDRVPEALSVAVASSISHLTISNCNIALADVRAVILLCPSLETLEVKQVAADANPIASLYSLASTLEYRAHGLRSLAITSHTRVDPLFDEILFPSIQSISLRLPGEGKWTNFGFLQSLGQSLKRLRIRGDIPPAGQKAIHRETARRQHGFELDMGLIYEAR
ncbi:hypothetical protein H1R20_g15561, partial [Candolleomyces eurysporus]